MTVEEFAGLITAETEDYELVDGQLIPLPSATPLHSMLVDRISRFIGNYFAERRLGGVLSRTDCRIHDDVRRPDVSVFLGGHWDHLDFDKTYVPFAPDIAVEVLSPPDRAVPMNRKVRDYLSAGSAEAWLLDPNGELHVRTESGIRLLRSGDLLETPLLPGFSAKVSVLLAGR